MASFAQLYENNIVLNVIVVSDEDCWDENGNELESVGIAFLKDLFGDDTNWAKNSINTYVEAGNHFGSGYFTSESGIRVFNDGPKHVSGKPFRKQSASKDFWFDEANDGFRPPKDFPWCDPTFDSWTFNTTAWKWVAPKPMPEFKDNSHNAIANRFYFWEWDEGRQDWVIWKIAPEDRDGKDPDVIGSE